MPKLTIIVPVYNVEAYLSRCLDSILAQEYTNFELILINDGSPDNCAEIMEVYAKRDNRIVTIYQDNKGVSAARNAGLKIAKGQYVGFVDPDDYIDKAMFRVLIEDIEEFGADIACCNFNNAFEDGTVKEHKVTGVNRVMSRHEFINHIFDTPRTIAGSNCNKLFLKDKITHFYDETLSICEDNLFLTQYCVNIKKACYCQGAYYNIFENKNSATRFEPRKIVMGLDARLKLIGISDTIDKSTKHLAEKDYLDSCHFFIKQLGDKDDSYFRMGVEHFAKYISKNFLSVMSNKEIYWKTKVMYLSQYIRCKLEVK